MKQYKNGLPIIEKEMHLRDGVITGNLKVEEQIIEETSEGEEDSAQGSLIRKTS